MLILIEVLIFVILAMIFFALVVNEKRNRHRDMRMVKLKGYWSGNERRSVDRLDISLQVKYIANGATLSTRSADISAMGIRLLLDEKIEKGSSLRMEIKLPDESYLIRASGEVVWAEESKEDEKTSVKRFFNTGIKFSGFQNADAEKLSDFIHTLPAQKP